MPAQIDLRTMPVYTARIVTLSEFRHPSREHNLHRVVLSLNGRDVGEAPGLFTEADAQRWLADNRYSRDWAAGGHYRRLAHNAFHGAPKSKECTCCR